MTDEQKTQLVVDEDGGLRRLGGDREIYNELMELFIDNSKSQMEELKVAVDNLEAESIEKLAHSIKGAAANLGILLVQETAQDLEKMGRMNNLEDINDIFGKLEFEFKRFQEYWKA